MLGTLWNFENHNLKQNVTLRYRKTIHHNRFDWFRLSGTRFSVWIHFYSLDLQQTRTYDILFTYLSSTT